MEQNDKDKIESQVELFGIFFEDEGNCLHIKSNKLGLKSFITRLENAYQSFDNHFQSNTNIKLSNENRESDYFGETELLYIEPLSVLSKEKLANDNAQNNIKEKLFALGCGLILLLMLFIFSIGVLTIYSSLFL